MATGAIVARIITQYSDKGSKQAYKDINKLGKQFDAFAKKTRKSFAIAIAASAALSIKIGTDAVKAAIEDSKSQAILATAMANSTGATKEAIAVAEDYIRVSQFRVNVSDTLLRASLSTLYVATGDLTEAQRLQTVALDVSAASGKDLQSVTIGITKAQQGNVGALKKLSPEISSLISKTTKFEDIMSILGNTYAGTAEQLAQLDPLTTLQLAYGEILETVGYKLLPMVQKFADQIVTVVLPAVDAWVQANGADLTNALEGAMATALKFISIVGRILGWANKYKEQLDNIVMLTAAVFTIANIGIFIAQLGIILTAWTAIAAATGAVATFTAIATAGAAVAAGLGALAMAGLGAATWYAAKQTNEYNSELGVTTDYVSKLTEKTYGGAAAEKYKAEVTAAAALKLQKIRDAAAAKAEASNAKAAAAEKIKLAAEKLRLGVLAKLAKMSAVPGTGKVKLAKGVVPTSTLDAAAQEAIQFEAARLNLVKQGNLAEAARIAMMGKNLELQLEANKALARYNDLLAALADKEISSEEVFLLSKKWGMTIEATQSYIQTLLAVADQTISDDEITNLAKAWGVSKEKAGMYLDFFTYLNDGKLSDAEIAKLQSKWGLTSKEVGIYADLITKASDYVLSDKEIEDLKKNWGLTTDEVVAYIRKLGQPVTFSGTLIDPATQATLGWKNALAALQAYLAALAGKGIAGVVPAVPVVPGGKPIVPSPIVPGYGSSKDEKEEAAAATTSGGNLIKALEEIASATTTETINAAVAAATEIGATASEIANSMVAGLLEQGVSTQNALSTARYTGQAIAAQQQAEQEAAERALRNQQYAEGMAKRYGGFVGSSTIDNAKGLTGSSSGTASNITINVAGSVTSEQDLVQTIRSGLLRGQYNGQSLTLEAI